MTAPLELAGSETTSIDSRSGERLSNNAIACADASRRAGSFLPARMIPDPPPPEPVRVYGRDACAGFRFTGPPVMVPDPPGGLRLPILPRRSFPVFSRPISPRGSKPSTMLVDGTHDPRDAEEDDALLLAERDEPEEMHYDEDAALADFLEREAEEDRRRDEAEDELEEEFEDA